MSRSHLLALGLLATIPGLAWSAPNKKAAPAAPQRVSPLDTPATPEASALAAALRKADYRFTPEVRAAYLTMAKAQAKAELQAAGKSLPQDFLAWVDSDPVVEATIYTTRLKASDVLCLLRSLELDLGIDAVRKQYTQLALATAIVHSNLGPQADLTPRSPLKLVIPGDPRHPVNTKDPSRTLDLNDHIVNFLTDHPTIEEDVVTGYKEELPPLKYDAKGVAIPAPKAKPKKVPVTEKRQRKLVASDVLASQALQDDFNAYMKQHGQSVEIHCGDHVIYPNRHDAVREPEGKGILEAYRMFRAAYEAKGLLPENRDASPTPAEACAYIIRNNVHVFPDDVRTQRQWPRFPITAPWPVLTLLANDDQPLREREEIWTRFRDKGEMRCYGEYIGGIAQQFDFQSARRLSPFAFTYNTYQMMAKDGGVCGTMGNMGARTYKALGIPSCTAGQPGHCALIAAGFDPKSNTYNFHGGQYATAGDEGTHPHAAWVFGEVNAPRDMVYHQSVAWAVNAGLSAYLDSTMAYQLYRQLPAADRQAHGLPLLTSGLALNPLNILLADAAQEQAATPIAQIQVWQTLQSGLATVAGKPGCPAIDGLYAKHARTRLFASLAKLPVPADPAAANEIHSFLVSAKCDNPATLVAYQVALNGLPAVLTKTREIYQFHLNRDRGAGAAADAACTRITETLKATSDRIPDKKLRQQWALSLWSLTKGQEKYFGNKNRITTDATIALLAKLAGQPLPPEPAMIEGLLVRLTDGLRASVAADRDLKLCRALAAQISEAGKVAIDPSLKDRWLNSMAQTLAGHEEFRPKAAKPNSKPLRDPCADAVTALRTPPPAAKVN